MNDYSKSEKFNASMMGLPIALRPIYKLKLTDFG